MKLSPPQRIIFLTIFVDLLGFGIIIPILPAVSARYLPEAHAGVGAGMLMASFSLLQMLFSPLWGRLSDRYGRRPILLLSLAGSTASYVLFALSHNYALLMASRIVAGICGANIAAAQAYIADVTPPEERAAGMGLIGMAFGLGFAFGPVLGGGASWLALHLAPGWPPQAAPGIVAALICGLNLLWAVRRLPESLPPERRGQQERWRRFASPAELLATLRAPVIGSLILFFFLTTFAFANVEVSFSLFARKVLGQGEQYIYTLFIFIGLVMAVVQGGLVRRLAPRFGEGRLIVAGSAILAAGLILLPLVHSPLWMALPCAVLSVGQGLANPSVLALISRWTPATRQGNVFGTSQSFSSLARIVGPVFGGVLFDRGPQWPFWIAALLICGATIWAAALLPTLKQNAE